LSEEAMRWFTSDQHFAHRNILKYYPLSRPFADVDEMNAQLIARWNQRVSSDDEVIVVGDIIANRWLPPHVGSGILSMLNGRKTLVRGNHDPGDGVFLDGGFVAVVDRLVLDGNILVIHRPCAPENPQERKVARAIEPRLVIHGHTHAAGQERGKHLNVAVDRWDLYPVPWSEVERRLQQADGETGEWHLPLAQERIPQDKQGVTMAGSIEAKEEARGVCSQAVAGPCSCSSTWDSLGPDPCPVTDNEDCFAERPEVRVDPGDECCGTGSCKACNGPLDVV
jgi:calcineurin-like phosphoesterase family protein